MTRTPGATSASAARIAARPRRDEAFACGFQRLKRYVALRGTARVPAKYRDPDGYALGTWVWVRRQMYRQGRLPKEHARALERLPGWIWRPNHDRFATGVRLLTAYARQHGNVFPPWRAHEQGFPLASWASKMRRAARRGRLSSEQRQALEGIPHWTTSRPDSSRWVADVAEELRRFFAQHGHLRIPRCGATRQLAPRANRLRQWYRAGRMPAEIVSELEGVPGWSWAPRPDAWPRALAAFRAYTARRGHGRLSAGERQAGVHLQSWARNQRLRYQAGKLQKERIRLLERTPHWSWDPARDRWVRGLKALRAFASREGHAWPGPRYVVDGLQLGIWVRTACLRYRRARLSPKEIRELERVPGWTWKHPRGMRSRERRRGSPTRPPTRA